jgi:hypothetical protein
MCVLNETRFTHSLHTGNYVVIAVGYLVIRTCVQRMCRELHAISAAPVVQPTHPGLDLLITQTLQALE